MANYLFLNFFSIGMLITTVFYTIAAIFCFTITNRSKAAINIGLALTFGGITAIDYFLSASFYYPPLAFHRYFSILGASALMIYSTQFFFTFPEPVAPRFRKMLHVLMWIMLGIAEGIFIFKSLTAKYVYQFSGHYWDFDLDVISKYVGFLILIFAVITIASGIWRGIITKDKKRWAIFAITFFISIVTIIPSIVNVLSRDGAFGREIYILTIDFFSVIGYFFIVIIFINNSIDRSTFMAKLVGISLVSILVIMLGLSYYSYQVNERFYNVIHNQTANQVLYEKSFRPPDLDYIVSYDQAKDSFSSDYSSGKVSIKFSDLKNEFMNTAIWTKIGDITGNNFDAELETVLNNAHPHFAGYKSLILKMSNDLKSGKNTGTEKNSVRLLRQLEDLYSTIFYRSNKIRELPSAGFRKAIENFLRKDSSVIVPFNKVILDEISKSKLDGDDLKAEVLNYYSPLREPGYRFYRKSADGMEHHLGYMKYNSSEGKVYEVGFSYLQYREFIHPDSLKLSLMLGITILVIIIGFPFFFYGAIVKALNRLQDGVREIRNGNFDIQIPVTVKDEIGFLTHNFNMMAQDIKESKRQIEDYAENLEKKVEERTAELEAARDALWGEMELAKKIQTVLLPHKPVIDGYELATHMAPADEVGGDYYDIINTAGMDWIIIGDVSGHGVSAGLIMMMAQTSIHTVLAGNYETSPGELLSHINQVLTENIRRLSDDKYMTITVISCIKDGVFHHAGLHQDIIIHRYNSQKIEILETTGMWLGIMPDIKPMMDDNAFRLEKGDVMLLYTDGLTEAWLQGTVRNHRNPETEMFGSDKLIDIFRDNAARSPKEIKEAILAALSGYRLADDVTLVVVKRTV